MSQEGVNEMFCRARICVDGARGVVGVRRVAVVRRVQTTATLHILPYPLHPNSAVVMMAGQGEDLKNRFRAARKPGPNDRVVELNKPLGIVLEEDEKGNVYVKDLTPGGNAARVRMGCPRAGVLCTRGRLDRSSSVCSTITTLSLHLLVCPLTLPHPLPQQSGKVQQGDLVTMISATFGDEMWSARNAGLSMIMQAIKVFWMCHSSMHACSGP